MRNKKQPKVAVLMPSYNVAKYIDKCMQSVLKQSLKDIEIICVDAGSEDGTIEKLKGYVKEDSRIHLYLSNKRSYGAQLNQALNNSTAEYIAIVETDDFIDEKMLETLYKLTKISYIDIVKSSFYHYDDSDVENIIIRKDNAKNTIPEGEIFTLAKEAMFIEGHPSIWSAIYKKDFLEKNNIRFMEEQGGSWVDNLFFIETAIKANTIVYTNEAYYYYRETNPESSTNKLEGSHVPVQRILDIFRILEENEVENSEIYEKIYHRLFRYVEIILENNDFNHLNLDYTTTNMIFTALNKVDESFVKRELESGYKKIYYKYSSPLILKRFRH